MTPNSCRHKRVHTEKRNNSLPMIAGKNSSTGFPEGHSYTSIKPETIVTYCADCGKKLKEVEVTP